jgi:hypothetical protein
VSVAIVITVGPRHQAEALDTIASIRHFCPHECSIILVDDCTRDGTWDLLRAIGDPRLILLRNATPQGYDYLVQSVALGLRAAAKIPDLRLVLKLDDDALLIGPRLFDDAEAFLRLHPQAGIFGRHLVNYDGSPKNFDVHARFLEREMSFPRNRIPGRTDYFPILHQALRYGWQLGENVFGGAYFLTGDCLLEMQALGHLETERWPRTAIAEDVYFTMCATAAGFQRGQFAAPAGPMGLAYDGLPAPARVLAEKGMKVIHTVDKGKFTSRAENDGSTPREFFARLRVKSL